MPAAPQSISVGLGERAYSVVIGAGLLADADADAHVPADLQARRKIIITDIHVAPHHLARLPPAWRAEEPIILPAGETSKSFSVLEGLCSALLSRNLDRQTLLVALGGGVVGDLVGFAAAIVLRGLDFIQMPTTLLAQVDSSVGGKTGINTAQGKNLIGAFHQPRAVLCDIAALATLPARELRSGYAEIVKMGLLRDADFFAWCEQNGPALLASDAHAQQTAIARSVQHKAAIVAADERETSGLRALLNLGHTFGHALEAECGYDGRLTHGEAVALGCVLAFDFSAAQGLCPPEDARRVRAHIAACGLPATLQPFGFAPAKLLAHMFKDKKAAAGTLTFILARGIGQAFVQKTVAPAAVQSFLATAP